MIKFTKAPNFEEAYNQSQDFRDWVRSLDLKFIHLNSDRFNIEFQNDLINDLGTARRFFEKLNDRIIPFLLGRKKPLKIFLKIIEIYPSLQDISPSKLTAVISSIELVVTYVHDSDQILLEDRLGEFLYGPDGYASAEGGINLSLVNSWDIWKWFKTWFLNCLHFREHVTSKNIFQLLDHLIEQYMIYHPIIDLHICLPEINIYFNYFRLDQRIINCMNIDNMVEIVKRAIPIKHQLDHLCELDLRENIWQSFTKDNILKILDSIRPLRLIQIRSLEYLPEDVKTRINSGNIVLFFKFGLGKNIDFVRSIPQEVRNQCSVVNLLRARNFISLEQLRYCLLRSSFDQISNFDRGIEVEQIENNSQFKSMF